MMGIMDKVTCKPINEDKILDDKFLENTIKLQQIPIHNTKTCKKSQGTKRKRDDLPSNISKKVKDCKIQKRKIDDRGRSNRNNFTRLNDIGVLNNTDLFVNVPANGNCGYHVLLLGLEKLGKTHCLISTDIQYVRFQIYNHGKKFFYRLKNKMRFCIPFNWDSSEWEKNVLSTIYKPNVDFSRGADEDCWWNCIDTTGIVCDLFKINIVIYCLPNPKTLAFEFFTNEIKYTEIEKKK